MRGFCDGENDVFVHLEVFGNLTPTRTYTRQLHKFVKTNQPGFQVPEPWAAL